MLYFCCAILAADLFCRVNAIGPSDTISLFSLFPVGVGGEYSSDTSNGYNKFSGRPRIRPEHNCTLTDRV